MVSKIVEVTMYREKHIIVFLVAVLLVLITGCRRTSCQVCLNILDIITITDLSIHTEELSMG